MSEFVFGSGTAAPVISSLLLLFWVLPTGGWLLWRPASKAVSASGVLAGVAAVVGLLICVLVWFLYLDFTAISVSSSAVELRYPWPRPVKRIEMTALQDVRVVKNQFMNSRKEAWFLQVTDSSGETYVSEPLRDSTRVFLASEKLKEATGKPISWGVRRKGRFSSIESASEAEVSPAEQAGEASK